MGFLDFFRRKQPVEPGTEGGGIGDYEVAEEQSQPGLPWDGSALPATVSHQVDALYWEATHEAINVGRMDLDPDRWHQGEMGFPYERRLAHEFEYLRDGLSHEVSLRMALVARNLVEQASAVAQNLRSLRSADRRLAEMLVPWSRAYKAVHEDELELGRYFKLKSKPHKTLKYVLAAVMVLAEVAMSIALWSELSNSDIAELVFFFALGLIMILVVVPHYAAQGLKDGVTRYHQAAMDSFEAAGQPAPTRLRRMARLEEIEDKGIRHAAGWLALVLLLLIFPVSWFRANELGDAGDEWWLWFAFYALLQAAISAYFFLREWIDYGTTATILHHSDEARVRAEIERDEAFEEYRESVQEFFVEAEELNLVYREAPRWDSAIVQRYLATVYAVRQVVAINHPDLDYFIHNAPTATLPSPHDNAPAGARRLVDPIAQEHPALASDSIFGRGWWMEQLDEAMQRQGLARSRPALPQSSADSGQKDSSLSLDDATAPHPSQLLEWLLGRYFDLHFPYRCPAAIDEVAVVEEIVDPLPLSPRPSTQEPQGVSSNGLGPVPTQPYHP